MKSSRFENGDRAVGPRSSSKWIDALRVAPDTLRCPACDGRLDEVEELPDPTVANGRMRLDIDCPACETALAVFLEVLSQDGLAVRKFVERRTDR